MEPVGTTIQNWSDMWSVLSQFKERADPKCLLNEKQTHLHDKYRRLAQLVLDVLKRPISSETPIPATRDVVNISYFLTTINAETHVRDLSVDDLKRLMDCIQKVNIVSKDVLLTNRIELLIQCDASAFEIRTTLHKSGTKPAQFVLKYLQSDEILPVLFLQQFFQKCPVLLDPSTLSGREYQKLAVLGIDWNSTSHFETPPLLYAVQKLDQALFQLMISCKANIGILFKAENVEQTREYFKKYHPHLSTDEERISFLLKEAPAINECPFTEHLCFVLMKADLSLFENLWPFLKSKGYRVSMERSDETMLTALLKQDRLGVNVETLAQRMIDLGVPVDTKNQEGLALRLVLKKREYSIEKMLIEAGANPNHSVEDRNPVDNALYRQDREYLLTLVKRGIDFDRFYGPYGTHALTWSIEHAPDLVEIIFAQYASIAHLTQEITPMSAAFRASNPTLMVRLAKKGGATSRCYNKEGMTPLTVLFNKRDYLRFKATIQSSSSFNNVAQLDQEEIVQFPIDVVNGKGETCFFTILNEKPGKNSEKNQEVEKFIKLALTYHPNWFAKTTDRTMPIHKALRNYPQFVREEYINLEKMLDLDTRGVCPMDIAYDQANTRFIKSCWKKIKGDPALLVEAANDFTPEGISAYLIEVVKRAEFHAGIVKDCLEIAVLLNVKQFSYTLQTLIPQEIFVKYFVEIIKAHPEMTHRYWLNHVARIYTNHLGIQPLQTRIPKASEDIDYRELYECFKSLNVDDEQSIDYISPETLTAGTKFTLEEFQKNVYLFFLHLELSLNRTKVNHYQTAFKAMADFFDPQKTKAVFTKGQFKEKIQAYLTAHPHELGKYILAMFEETFILETPQVILKKRQGIDPSLTFDEWSKQFSATLDRFLKPNNIADPDTFYPEIINNLRNIYLVYCQFRDASNDDEDECIEKRQRILIDLGLIANECSNRWKTGTHEQCLLYFRTEFTKNLEEHAISKLNELRIGIANEIAGVESHRRTQVYMNLANAVKLWGIEAFVGHKDFNEKRDLSYEKLLSKFARRYCVGKVCEFAVIMIKEHMDYQSKILSEHQELDTLAWYKQNLPRITFEKIRREFESQPHHKGSSMELLRVIQEEYIDRELFADKEHHIPNLSAVVHFLTKIQVIKEINEATVYLVLEALNPKIAQSPERPNKIAKGSPGKDKQPLGSPGNAAPSPKRIKGPLDEH